jgi:hypothetical protein
MRAIRTGGGVFVQREATGVALDGAYARSSVARGTDFGSHRGQHKLFFDQFFEVVAEIRRTQSVTGNTRHLNMMHRQYHGARSAPHRQRRTHSGELAHIAATAPEFFGHRSGQGLNLLKGRDGFCRETRLLIDVFGVFGGDIVRNAAHRGDKFFTHSGY